MARFLGIVSEPDDLDILEGDLNPDFDYEVSRDENGKVVSFDILYRTNIQLEAENFDCDCCRRKGLYAKHDFELFGYTGTLSFIPEDFFDIEAFVYLFCGDSVFLKVGYRFLVDCSESFTLKDVYSCLLADNGDYQVEIKPYNYFTKHNLNFLLHRQYSLPYLIPMIERELGRELFSDKAGDV